jgi:hypothetical protein
MLTETLASYLDGLGYGNFFPTGYDSTNNIFVNYQPELPSNIISIFDTGGEGSIIGFPDTKRSFQIIVRNEKHTDGNYLAWAIHNALTTTGTNGFLSVDGRNMLIRSRNTPVAIGRDQNNLFEWSINFDVWTQSDI